MCTTRNILVCDIPIALVIASSKPSKCGNIITAIESIMKLSNAPGDGSHCGRGGRVGGATLPHTVAASSSSTSGSATLPAGTDAASDAVCGDAEDEDVAESAIESSSAGAAGAAPSHSAGAPHPKNFRISTLGTR